MRTPQIYPNLPLTTSGQKCIFVLLFLSGPVNLLSWTGPLRRIMKGHRRDGKNTYPAITLLVFFSLFASISLFTSDYLDSRSLLPDEYLDLSGIAKLSQKHSPPAGLPIVLAPPSAPMNFGSPYPILEVFFLLSGNSRPELTDTLRC